MLVLFFLAASAVLFAQTSAPSYPWLAGSVVSSAEKRIPPPAGFHRIGEKAGGFGYWLRGLPVKPGNPPVKLFDGTLKAYQEGHCAVLDIDVGNQNLQQCADAVIRLRAEYLRSANAEDQICFNLTNGRPACWSSWTSGLRPHVRGRNVSWVKGAARDNSYASFRHYLDFVFTYAGTYSLSRELEAVADARQVQAGDVFIQGGFPGHAVLVLDVAANSAGRRAVLLAQSYVPAQEIHVLRNPGAATDPWYVIEGNGPLATPEWPFPAKSLRRFAGRR
jgi:hypothetical protein